MTEKERQDRLQRLKMENEDILKCGFLAMAIVFIACGSYYFNSIEQDFDNACGTCTTQSCMDNDFICGDFGIYYLKFAILIAMVGVGSAIIFSIKLKEEAK